MNCIHCGTEIELRFMEETNQELLERGECFKCNHFMRLLRSDEEIKGKGGTRIVCLRPDVRGVRGRSHYTAYPGGGRTAGFGGDKWRFKMVDTGSIFESTNLWHQGEIPECLNDHFPINAELCLKDGIRETFAADPASL